MNISICILNWQAAPLTLQCLKYILRLDNINSASQQVDIIIVDNGSQDDSARQINSFINTSSFKRFHFIQSTENKGYASGNNLAIDYSLQHLSPDYIWILNNDTLPSTNSLSALLNAANNQPSVAIWGSTLLDQSGEYIECAGGSYYHPCLSTYTNALKGNPADAAEAATSLLKPLDYIEGAAMFVNADVFRKIGLFNDDYFLYFEELDLIKRLPSGWGIEWCSKSFVRHIGGGSMESEIAEYQSNISALIFTRKHYPYCLPFMAIFRFIAKIFRNTLTGRWHLNQALLSSYAQYFFGR